MRSYWQGLVCASWNAIRSHSDVWSNDWDVAEDASERSDHATEEHPDAISLNHKSNESPSRQNQQNSCSKRQRTLPLSAIGKEGEGFRRTDESRDADKEENVAHGQKSAVEEEEDAKGQEESAGRCKGCADLCILVSIALVSLYGDAAMLLQLAHDELVTACDSCGGSDKDGKTHSANLITTWWAF